MAQTQRVFVPAAGHDRFLPLYDPLTRLLGVDQARRELVVQAALQPGHRVLDVGCGTGTFAVLIKSLYWQVDVTALDPDAKALARARRKAESANVLITFEQGFSDALPHEDSSFDRVFSSMMFHHLDLDEKRKMLVEVVRVLKPGGRLHLLDFGGPETQGMMARWLHADERMRDNGEEMIVRLMSEAGFVGARKVGQARILFGGLAYYHGARLI